MACEARTDTQGGAVLPGSGAIFVVVYLGQPVKLTKDEGVLRTMIFFLIEGRCAVSEFAITDVHRSPGSHQFAITDVRFQTVFFQGSSFYYRC